MAGWGSVDRDRLNVLREWAYDTSPTAGSLATYLTDRFPAAEVERLGAESEADGVAIRFADSLGQRFRTAFHVLREGLV